MTFFGVEVEDTESLNAFVKQTNERFEGKGLATNPFIAKIIRRENKLFVYICPVYFNFPKMAFLFMSIGYLFFRGLKLSYWLIPIGVFFALNIFWFNRFYFWIMKMGARKKGYKGKFKFIGKEEFVKEMVFWDSEKS